MDDIEEYKLCIKHIRKEVQCKGVDLKKPTDGSVCTVNVLILSGKSPTQEKFSVPTDVELTIGLGDEVFDKVLEYCITTMSVGETSTFFVPAISFNIKFQLNFKSCDFKAYIFEISDDQKYAMANDYKQQGVELFKQHNFLAAFCKFKKSLQYILSLEVFYLSEKQLPVLSPEYEPSSFGVDEVVSTRVALYNNLAFCQLHYKNYSSVVTLCTKSIKIQPNAKAYYRRALALIELTEYESAENDLKDLLKIEQNNKAAAEKLKYVRNLDKDNRECYKATIKKMFG